MAPQETGGWVGATSPLSTPSTQYGVYLPEGRGVPAALFADPDAAQQWRKSRYGSGRGVVLEATSFEPNPSVIPLLGLQQPPAPAVESLGEAQMRARIRTQEHTAMREDEMRSQVREELEQRLEAEEAEREQAERDLEAARQADEQRRELEIKRTVDGMPDGADDLNARAAAARDYEGRFAELHPSERPDPSQARSQRDVAVLSDESPVAGNSRSRPTVGGRTRSSTAEGTNPDSETDPTATTQQTV